MARRNGLRFVAVVVAVAGSFAIAAAAAANPASSPPRPHFDPAGLGSPGSSPKPSVVAEQAGWSSLVNAPPFDPEAMLLLTNGDVMVQEYTTGNWWELTPDSSGSYVDGTWSEIASLPAGYAPEYYASAVLPDGRVIVEGGEYNYGDSGNPTNLGAIYDPTSNTWTSVSPPTGWTSIGDAESVVLDNGQFMLAQAIEELDGNYYCAGPDAAILDEATLTWTSTGTGKTDDQGCYYDEDGFTLLPDGQVLLADTWRTSPTKKTEIYTPSTGAWTNAGKTPKPLGDDNGEMGPAALLPNGTVFAEGASGNNAIYNSSTGAWAAAPGFPGGFLAADAPNAVLPNGKVLAAASASYGEGPEHFFLFHGTTIRQIADPPGASSAATYYTYMLDLPTGQVLVRIGSEMEVYTPSGSPKSSWEPQITSFATTLAPGDTYTVSGTQLNGLTQGANYGDDFQDATNFPLVRITNTSTDDVFYAPTANMTSMSVAPGNASSANFTVPSGIETGPSSLVVVANGIASAPVSVDVS